MMRTFEGPRDLDKLRGFIGPGQVQGDLPFMPDPLGGVPIAVFVFDEHSIELHRNIERAHRGNLRVGKPNFGLNCHPRALSALGFSKKRSRVAPPERVGKVVIHGKSSADAAGGVKPRRDTGAFPNASMNVFAVAGKRLLTRGVT